MSEKVPFETYEPLKTGPRGQFEKGGVLGDGPSHDSKTALWLILIGTIAGIALVALFDGESGEQLKTHTSAPQLIVHPPREIAK